MSNGQNVDNFLSERSSTRRLQPAGGSSQAGSLIFGGGSSLPVNRNISSNKFANGSNQNCGNYMTGRSSTRLHAPPGGSSQAGQLIFGGGSTTTQSRQRVPSHSTATKENVYRTSSSMVGQTQNNVLHHATNNMIQKPPRNTTYQQQQQQINQSMGNPYPGHQQAMVGQGNNGMPMQQRQQPPTRRASGGGTSSNAYANGSNQNCGNFITDRPTTRVHAPPGGTSQAGSLIFGGGR